MITGWDRGSHSVMMSADETLRVTRPMQKMTIAGIIAFSRNRQSIVSEEISLCLFIVDEK